MGNFTLADARSLLEEGFAPWVQDLNITFDDIDDGVATLRVPPSPRLNRLGGMVCGQAIMSLADTAMVFAIASSLGKLVPMTTVSQTTAFLRAATDNDLVAVARVIKLGKQIVYGEVNLYTDDPDKPVAHVTSTNMLL